MEEMKHLNRKAEVPKPTDLNYRIGLDIGIASVGWAVLENNTHDEPFRIIDLGVRIFDTAEQPKTGASLALPRREARSARRRLNVRTVLNRSYKVWCCKGDSEDAGTD